MTERNHNLLKTAKKKAKSIDFESTCIYNSHEMGRKHLPTKQRCKHEFEDLLTNVPMRKYQFRSELFSGGDSPLFAVVGRVCPADTEIRRFCFPRQACRRRRVL